MLIGQRQCVAPQRDRYRPKTDTLARVAPESTQIRPVADPGARACSRVLQPGPVSRVPQSGPASGAVPGGLKTLGAQLVDPYRIVTRPHAARG